MQRLAGCDSAAALSLAAFSLTGFSLNGLPLAQALLEPLLLIHRSLEQNGAAAVADGRLTDLIRRVHTFGMALMKLDLRQAGGPLCPLDASSECPLVPT